jgi:hypothetical protein
LCNVDLLGADDLDVVICFSAMTSHVVQRHAAPLERAVHSLFGLGAEQLDRHADALARRGVDVIVVEPTEEDHAAMGVNLMDARRWGSVLDSALSSVARQLRRRHLRTRLGALHRAA